MPSPFPGVDPYLESPRHWSDFHERFITYACDAVQAQLPDGYRARIGERLSIEASGGARYPDVSIVERRDWMLGEAVTVEYHTDAGPVSVTPDRPVVFESIAEDPLESYVQIIDHSGEAVVTVIELLSPANKTSGEGQDLYLAKQRQLIRGKVHLAEIDLLHGGRHTVALPAGHLGSLEPHYSLVCVARALNSGPLRDLPGVSARAPPANQRAPASEGRGRSA